jgi:uracil-DNA glycosylase
VSALDYFPAKISLKSLREAASHCHGCDLYKCATQTVFGEGAAHARMMFVGEQPGDSEDREGHPFVGPAGKLLQRAMHDAGIDPHDVYITNAVKHFKFVERGKRRIHAKPKTIEIRACKPWLDAEIAQVHPALILALGATAAQALMGPSFKVLANRGRIVPSSLPAIFMVTVHPSSILRARDDDARHAEMAQFTADLEVAAKALDEAR